MLQNSALRGATQQYHLTAKCWSVKSGKKGGFVSNPDTKHYLWIDSSNQYTQDKQEYLNVSFISIWTNIMSNTSMLFNKSWCDFIIKMIKGLVPVPMINYAFIHLLLNAEVTPSINTYLTVYNLCFNTAYSQQWKKLILPNFTNL